MRILFYLPVVTPWWFSNIVIHAIRAVARDHDVHVMVPPLWSGTGISMGEADHLRSLPNVHWHILDGPNHPRLRINASNEGDLIEFVQTLAPDLTLCRSADMKTPTLFPGTVRFIMEGGAPPFDLSNLSVTLKKGLFDHGFMPEFGGPIADQLDAIANNLWSDMIARQNGRLGQSSRTEFLASARLDMCMPIIGLPLEYEQAENFFGQHNAFPDNTAMVRAITEEIGDEATLLVTHHPLTEQYGETSAVNGAILEQNGRVKLLKRTGFAGMNGGDVTFSMIQHCDAVIVGNSKCWSIAAAMGTPMVRLSDAPTASWANAYRTLPLLLSDLSHGKAIGADSTMTKRWFAHHILNSSIEPADSGFCAQDLIDRASKPADIAWWDAALVRYRALNPEFHPKRELLHAH